MSDRKVALKYVGGGSWLPNVPARDLTEKEADEHKDTINANKRAMGRPLYVAVYEQDESEADEI